MLHRCEAAPCDEGHRSAHLIDVVIDTDVGTDIDDAFALALALVSPEIRLLGITTASGDVALRARLVDRLLFVAGRTDVPVAVGIPTPGPFDAAGRPIAYSQSGWAEGSPLPPRAWPPATAVVPDLLRAHPHGVTLVCIGPLTTIAALLADDPATFRTIDRIVLMGGSIEVGFGGAGRPPQPPPVAEYNIVQDVRAAQAVFASGVRIDVFPLDATQVRLEEAPRRRLFAAATPLTDALHELYDEWRERNPWGDTPTLFDVVALAALLDPGLCPLEPLRIAVDDRGFTRREEGPPNARVCMRANAGAIVDLLIARLVEQRPQR